MQSHLLECIVPLWLTSPREKPLFCLTPGNDGRCKLQAKCCSSLLHKAQPAGLTFLWSNLAEQTSGTCKQTPRFRHLVIRSTERVFLLQFIVARVGRAAFQAGQSERLLQALVGQGILRSGTDCRAKSSLWCFMTVQCVRRYLGLEIHIQAHLHTCSTTHRTYAWVYV